MKRPTPKAYIQSLLESKTGTEELRNPPCTSKALHQVISNNNILLWEGQEQGEKCPKSPSAPECGTNRKMKVK